MMIQKFSLYLKPLNSFFLLIFKTLQLFIFQHCGFWPKFDTIRIRTEMDRRQCMVSQHQVPEIFQKNSDT